MENKMFFGKKLKELRIDKAKMGTHKFAEKVDMSPLDLNHIEHGYMEYPKEKEWVFKICSALEFSEYDAEEIELLRLWDQPFIMQEMEEGGFPGPLAHKSNGERLTEKEFIKLHEHIQNYKKEHNKKARKYNKAKEEETA
jgi:hypothetical protein